jgi:cytochrome c biogenesis protein
MELPFEVACEKFELQTYPDGRPKDYLSRLVVRKGGQIVQNKTIEVNSPLIQDGIFFYQSSYGQSGGGAVLRVLDRDGRVLVNGVRIPKDGALPIPGTDLAVEVVDTSENFNGFGPAAQLALVRNGQGGHAHVGKAFVAIQNFPDFDKRRGGDQVFQLLRLLPGRSYTGLQVAKDPGVPFIWAGSILLTLGTLMAFFAAHRRIWVHLEDGRLSVAGIAAKNQSTFRETMDELMRELRERTQVVQQQQARRAAG